MAPATGRRRGPIHGINITPLVDILLVLLVLVLVTGTLAAPRSVDLELPRSATASTVSDRPTEISVSRDGSLRIDGAPATLDQIGERLRERLETDSLHRTMVSAHRTLACEKVVEVIDRIREAGGRRYALRTEE